MEALTVEYRDREGVSKSVSFATKVTSARKLRYWNFVVPQCSTPMLEAVKLRCEQLYAPDPSDDTDGGEKKKLQ